MSLKPLIPLALALALAPALTLAQDPNYQTFKIIAQGREIPFYNQTLQARNYNLWIGGPTNASCPVDKVGPIACDETTNLVTSFVGPSTAGSPVNISMNSQAGQTVFVAPAGNVSYLVDGNNNSDVTVLPSGPPPTGAVYTAFDYHPYNGTFDENDNYVGALGWVRPVVEGAKVFVACPLTSASKKSGPWQVFANVRGMKVPSGNRGDCHEFRARIIGYDNLYAWQYN